MSHVKTKLARLYITLTCKGSPFCTQHYAPPSLILSLLDSQPLLSCRVATHTLCNAVPNLDFGAAETLMGILPPVFLEQAGGGGGAQEALHLPPASRIDMPSLLALLLRYIAASLCGPASALLPQLWHCICPPAPAHHNGLDATAAACLTFPSVHTGSLGQCTPDDMCLTVYMGS